jgi:hypothetical protein
MLQLVSSHAYYVTNLTFLQTAMMNGTVTRGTRLLPPSSNSVRIPFLSSCNILIHIDQI